MSEMAWRLLIAEDNESDVYLIEEALTGAGIRYEAKIATDGEEALTQIKAALEKSQAPDAVILDLNLTTHSGFEILKQIRSAAEFSSTKIVVLTSSGSPNDQRNASELGADLYLRKPMNLQEFMAIGAKIKQLLEPGSAARL